MFGSLFNKEPKPSFGAKAASAIGRATILPLFVVGAKTALSNTEALGPVVESAAEKAGLPNLPVSGEELVKINAYAQMGLAGSLALGLFTKLSAWGLTGSLLATTVVGHAFWDKEDEAEKNREKLQFAKNMAVLGGLLHIATRR